nr:UvrD-like helicase, ATP-binding domain, P-loop containing nucleoside triphosphate hydrolase [Tanacetum cinerariifolium]
MVTVVDGHDDDGCGVAVAVARWRGWQSGGDLLWRPRCRSIKVMMDRRWVVMEYGCYGGGFGGGGAAWCGWCGGSSRSGEGKYFWFGSESSSEKFFGGDGGGRLVAGNNREKSMWEKRKNRLRILLTGIVYFIKMQNGRYLEVRKCRPASQVMTRFCHLVSDEIHNVVSVNPGGGRNYVENSKVSESLLLMKFYLLSYEVRVANDSVGIYKAENYQLREVEVVHDPENNKPTVLCQLFVTVSPQLCYVVKQHVSHLTSNGCSSAEIGLNDVNVTSEFSDIPDTFIDIPRNIYPLVITFHKFLMMLDGTLGNSFFEKFLEAREDFDSNRIRSRSVALQTFIRLKEVTFDMFCLLYWPHFNTNLTKKFDPSKVFAEIISHIKGCSEGKLSYEEGFVFASDTAQTIARGIDFRFQDIRSLFYKEFLSTRLSSKQEKGVVSEIKHMKQNFRTHVGVLDLAQSVIDILYCYFVHSIDNLEPETSIISGETHVFLESYNNENAIVKIFGGSQSGGEIVGFGAEQVILVRDDRARTEIIEYVGRQALVLTILECKGLEFQLDDSVAEAMRVASSPHEWRERGKKLFYENNFVMAMLCFERAGDETWLKLAKACGLRASADQIRRTHSESYFGYLREAADLFESIGKLDSAASCYYDLREYERAVCKSKKLFDKELKEHVSFKTKDLEEADQELLENCALGYHELLLLKEESGHFLENAELASSSGALLKEADLLEKARKFKEADLLLLWYVFISSLWGDGNISWPLKQFAQKEELCNKVKLLAKSDSGVMYNFVCIELKLLSDQHNSLRELKEDLTLVFYWNLWKKHISDILRSVESLEKEEPFKVSLHADFCLYYFGVRKQFLKGNTMYLSLNKDADWIRNTCNKGLQRDEKRIRFDGRDMVSTIWSYCISLSYLDIVFPLDWRKSVDEDLVSIRETDLSVNLLEEIILQTVDIKALERVIIICLCSRVSVAVYKNLINKLKLKSRWKSFVKEFRDRGLKDVSVARALQHALNSSFGATSSFLSLHSFGYLLDRLLLMHSFSLRKSYTTRSLSVGQSSLNLSVMIKRIKDILSCGEFGIGMIQRSKIDGSYYPLLVLKMVMILSLICLKLPNYSHRLLQHLSGYGNYAYFLPKKFVSCLLRKSKNPELNLNPEVVAEAFFSVDDPLLIISSEDGSPKINAPCAIFVDIRNSKEEIMSVVFPRKNTHNVPHVFKYY